MKLGYIFRDKDSFYSNINFFKMKKKSLIQNQPPSILKYISIRELSSFKSITSLLKKNKIYRSLEEMGDKRKE